MNGNVAHKTGDCEVLNIYDKVINERIYFKNSKYLYWHNYKLAIWSCCNL